jgi:crotonobetainyl-CoA hydratase
MGGLTQRFGMNKPVIAAVNGYALGGGFELALACDIIVAAEHAEFGFPEPRVGRMPMDGGIHRLVRHIPLKLAMDLLLTGRRIDARDALRLGLVSEVVPLADLMAAARRRADAILACAPLSVQAVKEMAMTGLDLELRDAMALLTPATTRALASEDQHEGVAAFLEKRAPRWQGR